MITYTYKREDGTVFETKQRIDADPLEECPETGQPVERVINGSPSIVYKDDGYHHKDYDDSSNPAT
jgi:predicted nucleic acid-binding Zn ribbon protein